MHNKHLLVAVIILFMIAVIIYINDTTTTSRSSSKISESFGDTPAPLPNVTTMPPCQSLTPTPTSWWSTTPVKSIISKYSGIGINVTPADFPNYSGGNVDSNYQVMVESANTSIPKGALAVSNTGVFSKSLINNLDTNQLWKLKKITSVDDLKTLIGNPTMIVSPVNNPYFVVVALNSLTTAPVRALQYENGTLSVRPLGDYVAQQWDLSPVNVTPGIPILNNNQLSSFSPEYVDGGVENSVAMANASKNNELMSKLNQILGFVQATGINQAPTQSVFGSTSTNAASTPLTINVKLGSNVGRAVTSTSKFASTDPASLLKQYDDAQMGKLLGTTSTAAPSALGGLCTTPNMSDYVSKVGIPCTACASF
jgi:hypothetical protein